MKKNIFLFVFLSLREEEEEVVAIVLQDTKTLKFVQAIQNIFSLFEKSRFSNFSSSHNFFVVFL